jgi:hypothetical protein
MRCRAWLASRWLVLGGRLALGLVHLPQQDAPRLGAHLPHGGSSGSSCSTATISFGRPKTCPASGPPAGETPATLEQQREYRPPSTGDGCARVPATGRISSFSAPTTIRPRWPRPLSKRARDLTANCGSWCPCSSSPAGVNASLRRRLRLGWSFRGGRDSELPSNQRGGATVLRPLPS